MPFGLMNEEELCQEVKQILAGRENKRLCKLVIDILADLGGGALPSARILEVAAGADFNYLLESLQGSEKVTPGIRRLAKEIRGNVTIPADMTIAEFIQWLTGIEPKENLSLDEPLRKIINERGIAFILQTLEHSNAVGMVISNLAENIGRDIPGHVSETITFRQFADLLCGGKGERSRGVVSMVMETPEPVSAGQ